MIAELSRFGISLVLPLAILTMPAAAAPGAAPEKTDWKTYERKAGHFSISLPAGWKVVELDPALLDGSLRELGRANPELGDMLGPQVRALLAAGIEFFAIDAASDVGSVGFATNVNVLTQKMPAGMTLEANVAANAAQIEKVEARRGELEQKMIEIGGRKAGWVEYRVLIDKAKGREVAITQIYFLAGGRSLVFTFTTLASQSARYEPVFAAIAERLRVFD